MCNEIPDSFHARIQFGIFVMRKMCAKWLGPIHRYFAERMLEHRGMDVHQLQRAEQRANGSRGEQRSRIKLSSISIRVAYSVPLSGYKHSTIDLLF